MKPALAEERRAPRSGAGSGCPFFGTPFFRQVKKGVTPHRAEYAVAGFMHGEPAKRSTNVIPAQAGIQGPSATKLATARDTVRA